MSSTFGEAKNLASLIRYSGEYSKRNTSISNMSPEVVWSRFSNSGIEALNETIPIVRNVVEECSSRLKSPTNGIRVFIYASPEYQAQCLPIDDSHCAIRISSALIDNFGSQELAFVIGHEMGHYFLGHGSSESNVHSLEYFSDLRAREISADRCGLIACNNLDSAMRAIMKTVSGLSDNKLRFDTAKFLKQSLESISTYHDFSLVYSTHPAMPVRARCLLWFSNYFDTYYPNFETKEARNTFEKIDAKVRRDMDKYSEKPKMNHLAELAADCKKWIWLGAAVSDGQFQKEEQDKLTQLFGYELVQKSITFFSNLSIEQVKSHICDKCIGSMEIFIAAAPREARTIIQDELNESEQILMLESENNIIRNVMNNLIQ